MQKLPWIVALGLLAAAGCADDDPEHLRVRGEALVELGADTRTGFAFENDVRLDDDRVAPADGRIAGHCTIGVGDEGEHDVVSVGLSRTAPPEEEGMGMRSITVRMDGPATGRLEVSLGGDAYVEDTGAASCVLTSLYTEPEEGIAAVAGECELTGVADATATIDLHFAGCTVE